MKKNVIAFLLAISLMVPLGASVVSAHGDEVHEEEKDHAEMALTIAPGQSAEQLQKLLDILKQVVALMVERKKLMTETHAAPVYVEPVAHVMDSSMDTAHHDDDAPATTTPKFVIEVETHGDKTHVHARYLDKAEDMFFVDADLHDEAALIADIKARTGLTEAVIKAALKYFE